MLRELMELMELMEPTVLLTPLRYPDMLRRVTELHRVLYKKTLYILFFFMNELIDFSQSRFEIQRSVLENGHL